MTVLLAVLFKNQIKEPSIHAGCSLDSGSDKRTIHSNHASAPKGFAQAALNFIAIAMP